MRRHHWTDRELALLEEKIERTNLVCGIDEVGRGPLAGPVLSCAIIMPKGKKIEGVRDSKKLTEKKREALYPLILQQALAWGIGQCGERTIDRINIRQASLLSMKKALENLHDHEGRFLQPDLLLVDAERIQTEIPQISLVHGDDLIYVISCASIVAKVSRDRIMKAYAKTYPLYGFEKHKGYGTKAHLEAIKSFGILPLHRRTFIHEKGMIRNGKENGKKGEQGEPAEIERKNKDESLPKDGEGKGGLGGANCSKLLS